MLITNFAAGELAETLFGRIDLPQYFSGVSRLENFDVIPTGGISRRHGMKRVIPLDGPGRIIPFIMDRESSFLLYLTQGMIRIYDRNGVQQGDAIVSSEAVPLYQSITEINEVQYAQNYDVMVMCHENYAPILAKLIANQLNIFKFSVLYGVEIKSEESIDTSPYSEYDDAYYKSQYLNSPGNYPRSVTFFNGRVVFAGTKNNPQRIFFSQANDIYKFATYKMYLTEQRNYITVNGTIDPNDLSQVVLNDTGEGIKFTEPLENYIVDSPFYPKTQGEVKVVSLRGNILKLSRGADIEPALTPTEQQQLNSMITAFTNYNNSLESQNNKYKVGNTYWYYKDIFSGNWIKLTADLNFYIGSSQSRGMEQGEVNSSWGTNILPPEAAREIENNPNYLFLYIKQIVENIALSSNLPSETDTMFKSGGDYNETDIAFAANDWRSRILSTMRYNFRGEMYYNYPEIIKQQLIIRAGLSDNIYLPLYTSKILEDRYPTPDDGFTFEIASDMSDAIRWIAQSKNLLIGTETGEWVIPAGTHATNIQAILNSRYGSDRIQATSIGDAMCFFQSGKKALVEYYIPQQDNNFRANNMAMLNPNMLHESPAFDFDFISAPYTKIFVSREDGVIVCLLYERSTGTFAWGRITTRGLVKSVATMPGQSGYDDVFLVVERGGAYSLEMLAERRRSDHAEAEVFLDSYKTWSGDPAGYTAEAVVYDETDNKVYPLSQGPLPGHVMWVGYPFTSRVRSMPVLANDKMKPNVIKSLLIRFNNSFMPRAGSVSMDNGSERAGHVDSIPRPEPYSGVIQIPFPGVWDRDVFFELIHDKPTRCRILAVNAEAN